MQVNKLEQECEKENEDCQVHPNPFAFSNPEKVLLAIILT